MKDDIARARMARFIMALRSRGVRDQRILNAFERVPRESYLPAALEGYAYEDWLLPIAGGQTIESPFALAALLERAELSTAMKVLEVGTGTGFATALLARLCRRVHTIERLRELHEAASRRLDAEGLSNVAFTEGDALTDRVGPGFDRILVHGALARAPKLLLDQLAPGGRLIATMGRELVAVERGSGDVRRVSLGRSYAVPLFGVLVDPA